MVAAKLATMTQGARTDLGQICTKSSADAGMLLNVGERSVKSAKKVRAKAAPALIKAVEDGKIAVSVAASHGRAQQGVHSLMVPANQVRLILEDFGIRVVIEERPAATNRPQTLRSAREL
jgi:hypothetical protein